MSKKNRVQAINFNIFRLQTKYFTSAAIYGLVQKLKSKSLDADMSWCQSLKTHSFTFMIGTSPKF